MLSAYTLSYKALPKPFGQDKDHPNNLIIPEQFCLDQNLPNPFNPETKIRYQLPHTAHVTLAIYNLLGQKIRSLIDEQQASGVYAVHWDGRDENGSSVASGVYLYAISAGEFRQVRKMLLVR